METLSKAAIKNIHMERAPLSHYADADDELELPLAKGSSIVISFIHDTKDSVLPFLLSIDGSSKWMTAGEVKRLRRVLQAAERDFVE